MRNLPGAPGQVRQIVKERVLPLPPEGSGTPGARGGAPGFSCKGAHDRPPEMTKGAKGPVGRLVLGARPLPPPRRGTCMPLLSSAKVTASTACKVADYNPNVERTVVQARPRRHAAEL